MSQFAEAVRDYENVCLEYTDTGAYLLESRTVFADLISEVCQNGVRPDVPDTPAGWHLREDAGRAVEAAREMSVAAGKAVDVAAEDPKFAAGFMGFTR